MATAVRNKPRFGQPELQQALEWKQRDQEYSGEIETRLSPSAAWVARQMALTGFMGEPRLLEPFCSAYMVWHHRLDPAGATVAEDYFAEFPDRLRGREDWYRAQSYSWLGLWEVETADGRCLQVADRLTGERRYVYDLHDGQFIKPSYTILGRVVDIDPGVSVFSGAHPTWLPPHAGVVVRNAFMRGLFPSSPRLEPATLRDDVLFMMLKRMWHYASDAWLELRGTDRVGRIRDWSPALANSPEGREVLESIVRLLIDDIY